MHPSLFSQFDLTGKAAIVTGASRGLGVSFARGLAKAGCDLIIAARDMDRLRDVARDLEQHGRRVVPVQTDICRQQDVESMVQRSVAEFDKVDILVNNAGISAVADAEAMTREQWQSVIDTNLTALFFCAQCAARQMLRQGSGKIVNIASMYGISASSYVSQASYVTSKAGVLGLTRELAVAWAPRGVQVVALAPGFFRSDQTIWAFEQNKELGEKLLAKVPMGRMGKLEELEGTIVYLASSASDYMTGQALILDGGFLSW
ncbi:MAG: short-chain dehydrogenase [Acidobacteria bacterium]|nr:MAG: short-chain dehydrogenase [Acidobacteriota bacterium]